MWKKEFWKDAAERVIRTFIAAYLAIGGYTANKNNGVQELWNTTVLSQAAGVSIISLLMSLVAGTVKNKDDASFRS